MPKPNCLLNTKSLWDCEGFADLNAIPLTENLCQGEDDLGLYCWGPPIFSGWAKHWKGLFFILKIIINFFLIINLNNFIILKIEIFNLNLIKLFK